MISSVHLFFEEQEEGVNVATVGRNLRGNSNPLELSSVSVNKCS